MIITRCDVCGDTLIGTKEEATSFYSIEIEAEFIDVDDDEEGGWDMNHQFHICPACYEVAKSQPYSRLDGHSKKELLIMVKSLIEVGILTCQEKVDTKTE